LTCNNGKKQRKLIYGLLVFTNPKKRNIGRQITNWFLDEEDWRGQRKTSSSEHGKEPTNLTLMRRKSRNQAITFVEGQYSQHFAITQFPDPASYVSSGYSSFPSPKKPAFDLIYVHY